MSRRRSVLMLVLAGAMTPAGLAAAEPAPWAPLRFGGSVVLGVPLTGKLALTSFEIFVLQQAGWVGVDADGHGRGLIAGIGGTGGLGTFSTTKAGACADAVDAEGDTRWTCGQLTLGPTVMLGWASGPKLETGFVRQDRLLFVRATPHLALVKNPERGFAEVGLATAIGYAFHPFQLEATWIKIPGDAYVGVSIGLSASASGWLINDRPVPAALAAEAAAAEAEAAAPLSHWRLDFAGQAVEPVVSAGAEVTTGVGVIAAVKLSGFPDTPSRAWRRWSGVGGELRAVGSGEGDSDSAMQLGPVAMAGWARFDGDHPRYAVYGRVAPMIGWRERGTDDSFDYGGFVSVGATLGLPEDFGADHQSPDADAGPVSLGLELTAGWMRGAGYLGGGVELVFW